MRRSARVDSNQSEIVAALRAIGATVQPLHTIGQGCPDLLIGFDGFNWLLEIKNGSKSPSHRRLTPDEETWHSSWLGQVAVVNDATEAIAAIQKRHRDAFES